MDARAFRSAGIRDWESKWFGGVGISEANGLGEKTVEIRRSTWVAHGSEGVVTLIVGQKKDDIRLGFGVSEP